MRREDALPAPAVLTCHISGPGVYEVGDRTRPVTAQFFRRAGADDAGMWSRMGRCSGAQAAALGAMCTLYALGGIWHVDAGMMQTASYTLG